MTSKIKTHEELIDYMGRYPDIFSQKAYKFTVSRTLFDFYDRLIPDSETELEGGFISSPMEIDEIATKWMADYNVYLVWDTSETKPPHDIIRRICINSG